MKKNAEILFIMPALTYGGAEKVLVDYLNEIDYSKYSTTLCLLFKNNPLAQDIRKEVNIKYMLPQSDLFMRLFYKLFIKIPAKHKRLEFITKLYTECIFKKQNFNTAIAFMEGIPAYIVSCMNSKKTKKVVWIHTDIMKNHYTLQWFGCKAREEDVVNKFNEIVFVSGDVKKAFNNEFGNIKPGQHIIENIIPIDKILLLSKEFCPVKPENIIRICFIGRLTKIKRVDILLDSVKNLMNYGINNFDVLIVGDGPLKNDLIEKSNKYGIANKVEFVGFKKNPYPYIISSDIVINTSQTEGYPLSVCEAMCLGRAVVCTDTTGSNEILSNGKYGILTSMDPMDISEKLRNIITNPELLEHYKHLAEKRAKYFQKETIMKNFYSVVS